MNRLVRPAAFLSAVAAAAVIAALVQPDSEPQSPPVAATLTEFARSCPIATTPTALAAGEAKVHPSAETEVTKQPGGEELRGLDIVGGWSQAQLIDRRTRSVILRKRDDDGAGFVAFAAAKAKSGAGGGFALAGCPGVSSESWFVGAGSSIRHSSTLVLSNMGDTAAVADVEMVGADGGVEVVNGEGIVVDAETTKRIKLADMAAGEEQLTVRVSARRGAIAMSMYDTSTAVFAGSEWMPPAAAPASKQVVSGIPDGATGRHLLITNPSKSAIKVKIAVSGKEGRIAAKGFDQVSVPAGTIKSFDIPKSVGAEAVALRLRSSRDFTAAVRVAPSKKDFAYATPHPSVRSPAVIPLSIGKTLRGRTATLILTSGSKKSTVRIEAFNADMESQGSASLTVPSGHTKALDLTKKDRFDADSDDLSYAVVTASTPVRGSVAYGDLSILPLLEAPISVVAPHVERGR